jgi:hypothetical protein
VAVRPWGQSNEVVDSSSTGEGGDAALGDDLNLLREINPALKSFDDWLTENAANVQVD